MESLRSNRSLMQLGYIAWASLNKNTLLIIYGAGLFSHELFGKLNTMKRLVRLNIIPLSKIPCILCGCGEDEVDHLFVHYFYVSWLWKKALTIGGICWVRSKNIREFFELRGERAINKNKYEILKSFEWSWWICGEYVAEKQTMVVGNNLSMLKMMAAKFLVEKAMIPLNKVV
ncbi:hypothetical protein Ahy_A07g032538 [Arachis hypogaea]|uniref:Reverse transcriptase zinc-binding domain-containing protein n=1 Tax=Arachis hypogaea TaxID=3818 RepID=A0A445C777_ARAHY|nr:hypothetical protein Ahy_A07g032538 [Arachis hypogaea]